MMVRVGSLVIVEVPRAEGFVRRAIGLGDDGDRNFNAGWWSPGRTVPSNTLLLRAELDSVEVARVEMDADPRLGPAGLGPVREIYSIEVSDPHRGRGIGRKVVQRLVARFHDARLIATTNDAAGWWASLNWVAFDHPDMWGDWKAFVSPEI